jgi:hypothetical protein
MGVSYDSFASDLAIGEVLYVTNQATSSLISDDDTDVHSGGKHHHVGTGIIVFCSG